ncbi:MAG TPA: hypothetical protein ENN58_00470 [bacterium]|nr:hypothetical protein [bacterium]
MKKILLFGMMSMMLLSVSCSTDYIKGTDIEDNEDSRAVFTIFAHYVKGLRDQTPEVFIPYISKSYYDNNGTDDPSDDVDYNKIIEILSSDQFHSLKNMDLVYFIKDLKLDRKAGTAKLLYYFEVRFKRESKLQSEEKDYFVKSDGMTNHKISDTNEMAFVREEDEWKVIKGL